MSERDQDAETAEPEVATPRRRAAVTETAGGASAAVRDVIGRRGYDESEDESANEDEEH